MRRQPKLFLILLIVCLAIVLSIWGGCLSQDRTPAPPGDEALRGGIGIDAPTGPSDEEEKQPEQTRLIYVVLEDGRRVEGSFGSVLFEAEHIDGAGGSARFWVEGAEQNSASVLILSERVGTMQWQGYTFDGRGPLPEGEVAALEALDKGPMGEAIARIPLDLACRPDAEPVPAEVGAALLMPWQLLLKYAIDHPADAARARALEADCGYFGRRAPPDALGTAHPQLLMLSREQPIPMAFPYLPLDGVGQRGGPQ